MHIPKISITLDQNLDERVFLGAIRETPGIVNKVYNNIKTKQEVLDAINHVYGDSDENKKLNLVIKNLQDSPDLIKLMKIISQLLNYSWDNIQVVTIIPCASPIFPRFIENNSFLVPYYWPMNWILKNCAHELSHLLYFDKLQTLLGKKVDTEMPSSDWLISKIIAPIIVNHSKIQAIVGAKDTFYSPIANIISDQKQREIEKLFRRETDLLTFRRLAIKEIAKMWA